MTIRHLFIFTTLLFFSSLSANIKGRIGIFIPQDALFREIYEVGPSFELESLQSNPYLAPNLAFWENINLVTMNGHSTGEGDPTTLLLADLSFGPKVLYFISPNYRGYLGFGAVISGVWIHNHHSICCSHSSRANFGGVVKLGLQHYINPFFYMDFFLDYYYQSVTFESRVNLGGVRGGLGFGYGF